jgi:histidine triad (HIT) family protein
LTLTSANNVFQHLHSLFDTGCGLCRCGLDSIGTGNHTFIQYGTRTGRKMKGCVFCQIARGDIRSAIIYEDAEVIGLMDICPIRPGHAQIIPREHFDYFDDLPDVIACRIIHLGQRLARALKTLYGVPRVAFLFSGGDHAHAHAHVIPMHEKTDITSRHYIAEETLTFRNVARAPSDELAAIAAQLRNGLDQ